MFNKLFNHILLFFILLSSPICANEPLPVGSHPTALKTPHFPNRLHTFVWRNWYLVSPQKLAEVINTSPENITALATSMGLPSNPSVPPEIKKQGYITIIRRNWHLLPYEQLLTLVDMTQEELSYSLREDDFLYIKLGSLKPKCELLHYEEPTDLVRKRAEEIKQVVDQYFGGILDKPAEPRFDFIRQLKKTNHKKNPNLSTISNNKELRYIYSYFGVFGDPLIDSSLDPYPDGLLEKLSDVGVTGVWMHVVLRQLAPGGKEFPEFGKDHELRLKNLRHLVQKAKRYGISLYLYMNEPRSMPSSFFKNRDDIKGANQGDYYAMCTSHPKVRKWVSDSLAYVFTEVPDLGGVFTISASENLTNCASHFKRELCPRCKNRTDAEVIAEINTTIAEGVHRGNPSAKVIVWDWGWNRHGLAPETIKKLPKSVWFMSVSEWAQPFERGGIKGRVGEYSMSVVGPGPRAKAQWKTAREHGLKTVAKVAFNNTWELSTVPYLPVLDLVAKHSKNLAKEKVSGTMLSWSLGGYPSPNLKVAQKFSINPDSNIDTILDEIAVDRYGKLSAPHVRKAWTLFSKAFTHFPYSGAVLYQGPQQTGPANLFYETPTGYRSTMVGIPYDSLNSWRSPYPAETLAELFEKVASGWYNGIEPMKKTVELATSDKKKDAEADLSIAQAVHLHFASSANQVRFILNRNLLLKTKNPKEKQKLLEERKHILKKEIDYARRLYSIVQRDSRIGFEASNQYVYVPHDLIEKVINCEHILKQKK